MGWCCCRKDKRKPDRAQYENLVQGESGIRLGDLSNRTRWDVALRFFKEMMATFVLFGVALLTATEAPAIVHFPIASTLFDPTTNSTTVIQTTVPVQMVDTVKEFKFALVISITFCICLIVFRGASINPFNSLLGIVSKKIRDIPGYRSKTFNLKRSMWYDVLEAFGSWVFQLGGCVSAVALVYALNGGDVPYTLPGDGTSVAAAAILEGIFMWLMFAVSLVLHVLYDSDVCQIGRASCRERV